MTNEKIAALIGEGGNDELLPLLWEKMRRYYRMAATKYAAGHAERCARCGVTYEDIMQESYFAMLDAVQAYNSRPPEQSAMLFISFCGFPFRNHAAALIGMRTRTAYNEPLNNAAFSLDEPIRSDEGDGENSRMELVPDETAEEPFRNVEQADYCRAVRESVQAELSDKPRSLDVIERVYYEGETLVSVSTAIGVSVERVRQIKRDTLRQLCRCSRLRELYDAAPYRRVSVRQFRQQGSAVEQAAENRERLCRRMQ